jgi:ATP-dependent protease ClpP protease subunit
MNPDFYRFIVAEAEPEPESAELLIFDAIGNWEDVGEVSAKAFSNSLAQLPKSVKRIELHINSPGGSLFDASAIFSRLADHRSEKVVYIDGLAASAASIVAMVGHKIYMRANATMMIHLPSGLAVGNADDMRKMASALDTITDSMVNVYERRTRQPRDVIRAMLAAETWMSPDQAVANGFADEVRGVIKAAAMVGPKRAVFNGIEFDLSRFHNVPAFSATQPTKQGEHMAEPTPTAPPQPTPTPAPTPPPQPEPEPPQPGENAPQPAAETPLPGTRMPQSTSEPPGQGQRPAGDPEMPGARAERARVLSLMALDRGATHNIIVKAIKEGQTVADVTAACLDAMEQASAQDRRRLDARVLDGIPGSDGGTSADGDDFGARLRTAVAAKLKQRRSPVMLNSRN